MKRRWIWVYLLCAALGTGLHFLYDALPLPVVALFAPVNESVWEHLKLLFWPFLIATILLDGMARDKAQHWGAALAAQLLMPVVLTGVYYLLFAGFAFTSSFVNLLLYYLTLLGGFVLLQKLRGRRWTGRAAGVLILLAAFYACSLILFSIAAPPLPIFTPPA